MLIRHHFESGKAVFELNEGGHHDHLVCVQCGHVEEFYDAEIERRQVKIAKDRGFNIHEHSLQIYATAPSPTARTGLRPKATASSQGAKTQRRKDCAQRITNLVARQFAGSPMGAPRAVTLARVLRAFASSRLCDHGRACSHSLTPSISAACLRVVSVIFTPPSIRASLLHALGAIQRLHLAAHLAGDLGLADLPLLVGRGGHLRQVGDAHDLVAAARAASACRPTISATRPPMPASTSSNTSVGTSATCGGDGLDRQADARQLAAGGHLGQRPQRRARVRGDQELDLLRARRRCPSRSASARPRSARPPWPGPASARSPAGPAPRRLARARAKAAARPAGSACAAARSLRLQLLGARLVAQRGEALREPGERLRKPLRRDPVLARGVVHRLEALLDFLQAARDRDRARCGSGAGRTPPPGSGSAPARGPRGSPRAADRTRRPRSGARPPPRRRRAPPLRLRTAPPARTRPPPAGSPHGQAAVIGLQRVPLLAPRTPAAPAPAPATAAARARRPAPRRCFSDSRRWRRALLPFAPGLPRPRRASAVAPA